MSNVADMLHPVDINKNDFIDSKKGFEVIPSLMTADQERKFEIHHNWFVDGKSRLESLKEIRDFDMADEYRSIYLKLSQMDEFILKFIAEFKSVQKLHLIREASLFPELVVPSKINKSLRNLFINNLIWKWQYKHPIYGKNIDVFTLSTNGYYLLKMLSGSDHYFFPGLLLSRKLPSVFHVRFWETIDLYQLFVSLPAYRGSTTLFNGGIDENRIVNSPLQIAAKLRLPDIENLIFYPVLQTDGDAYYNHVIETWLLFTENGQNVEKSVNGLPGKRNVLTFYIPTGEFANEFNKRFQLNQAPFPIYYVIGAMIKQYGIQQSFFKPANSTDIDDSIEQVRIDNLLSEELYDD